ncbi:MAG: DUF547 domain-containing protein, partial [Planctomycetia bacterium]|nr:DUF547 domain-containing protein [Planctomycetia bacterium]
MNARFLTTLCLAALAVVALGWNTACTAGTKVTLGQNVGRGQSLSMDLVNHGTWDALLRRYVDESGNVAYAQWQKSDQDVQALDGYLATLSAADPQGQSSKPAQLAFWINAYNAVTIRGILREYPTTSIRNHTAKAFGYNIWKDLQLYVGGQPYHLEQMEHEILRKMGEPRIHFAIVCASISCPRLLNAAYTADRLDEQLTLNTKVFFSNPGNFQFDPGRRQMQLSSILKWFGEDFGNGQAAQ